MLHVTERLLSAELLSPSRRCELGEAVTPLEVKNFKNQSPSPGLAPQFLMARCGQRGRSVLCGSVVHIIHRGCLLLLINQQICFCMTQYVRGINICTVFTLLVCISHGLMLDLSGAEHD